MPKVSIVIPVHNGEKTLRRSLQSIADQTYKDFETIVVDNNCTDASMDIAREFEDSINLRIIKCGPKGIVPTLNTGIFAAQSEWIARQDDDDYWYPDKLEKQMAFLEKNPEVGILGTQLRLLDPDGNEESVGTYGLYPKYPTQSNAIKGGLMTGQNCICHPSVVIRKDVILRVGGYSDQFPLAEDMELWMKAIPFTAFANLDEVLVDYTQTVREDYDPRVVLILADMYYSFYRLIGLVEGERPLQIFDWQRDSKRPML